MFGFGTTTKKEEEFPELGHQRNQLTPESSLLKPRVSNFIKLILKKVDNPTFNLVGDEIHVRRDQIVSIDYDYEVNETTVRLNGYYHFPGTNKRSGEPEEKQRVIAFKVKQDFFYLICELNLMPTITVTRPKSDEERLSGEYWKREIATVTGTINQPNNGSFKIFTVNIPEELPSKQVVVKKMVYALNTKYVTTVFKSNKFVHTTEGFKYKMEDPDENYTYMTVNLFDVYSTMCDKRMATQIMATDMPIELVMSCVED